MSEILKFARLPFDPQHDQIIYIESKYDETINNLIKDNYDIIDSAFRELNVQFCYLPLLNKALGEEKIKYNLLHNDNSNIAGISSSLLNRYISNKERIDNIKPSLIRFSRIDYSDYSFVFIINTITALDLSSVENVSALVHRLIGNADTDNVRYSLCSDDCDCCIDYSQDDSIVHTPSFIRKIRNYSSKTSLCADEGIDKSQVAQASKYVPAEEMDAESKKLISEIEERISKLKLKGIEVLLSSINSMPKLSRLVVTSDFRIILPDYGNIEIEMTPLVKAVYLLFLRHEEGIEFKNLIDYRDELMEIYIAIRNYNVTSSMGRSVEDVTNPFKNSINEKRERIREAFFTRFNPQLAENYIIVGERGEAKRIPLHREFVEWQWRVL